VERFDRGDGDTSVFHGGFGHFWTIEDRTDISSEFPHFLGDAPGALRLDNADGEATETRDVIRAMAFANASTVSTCCGVVHSIEVV
jgi:hypothetical protein